MNKAYRGHNKSWEIPSQHGDLAHFAMKDSEVRNIGRLIIPFVDAFMFLPTQLLRKVSVIAKQ